MKDMKNMKALLGKPNPPSLLHFFMFGAIEARVLEVLDVKE